MDPANALDLVTILIILSFYRPRPVQDQYQSPDQDPDMNSDLAPNLDQDSAQLSAQDSDLDLEKDQDWDQEYPALIFVIILISLSNPYQESLSRAYILPRVGVYVKRGLSAWSYLWKGVLWKVRT